MTPIDTRGRPLRSLRLSVTDRCNLRCAYCMPEEHYTWLAREHLLSFEELSDVVSAFVKCGVNAVRLTGGEPLLRSELPTLVRLISHTPGITDIALTTNGMLLAPVASSLKDAGLHRLTVSIDTLDRQRFTTLTRRDGLGQVLAGIEAAHMAELPLKLDTVVMRGVNDHEITDLIRFAAEARAEIRFIEYMDVGGATRWRAADVVSRREMIARIEAQLGPLVPIGHRGSAPAERLALPSGQVIGLIASTTAPFCGQCDRARLSADGSFFSCLYASQGLDLRAPLRSGATVEELADRIAKRWLHRDDRGAERRLELESRGPSVSIEQLRAAPHLEMHTRGG